jgi:hypothetical protein
VTGLGSVFKPSSDEAMFKRHKRDHTKHNYQRYLKWEEISVPDMIFDETV